jgi:hypothetical protein
MYSVVIFHMGFHVVVGLRRTHGRSGQEEENGSQGLRMLSAGASREKGLRHKSWGYIYHICGKVWVRSFGRAPKRSGISRFEGEQVVQDDRGLRA